MYAHVVEWQIVPTPEGQASDEFADVVAERLLEQPGCRGVETVSDEGHLSTVSLWDTRDDAEAVTAAVEAFLGDEGSIWWPIMSGPPVTQVYDDAEAYLRDAKGGAAEAG